MIDTNKKKLTIQEFASMGGKARAAKYTKKEIAEITAKARDARSCYKDLPKATHSGILKIGDKEIECAVLPDGTRVITQSSLQKSIGKTPKGTRGKNTVATLPAFLEHLRLKPFITKELVSRTQPIIFKMPKGGRAYGYKAELLPEVCEVYLKAKDAGVLPYNQQHIAVECEVIIRALAKVGIVALVDEAAGFQYDRDCDALQKILSKYISEELLPWTKKFSHTFFESYKKMYGILKENMCPSHIGHFINKYIYNKLAPGILEELKNKNPKMENGRRNSKHHQWLTDDTGVIALDKQLIKVTTLMKISDSKKEFELFLEKTEKGENNE